MKQLTIILFLFLLTTGSLFSQSSADTLQNDDMAKIITQIDNLSKHLKEIDDARVQDIKNIQDSLTISSRRINSNANAIGSINTVTKKLQSRSWRNKVGIDNLSSEYQSLVDADSALDSQIANSAIAHTKDYDRLQSTLDIETTTTSGQIDELGKSIGSKSLLWIIGSLVLLILVLITFFTLRRQIGSEKSALHAHISQTQAALKEEVVMLDTKLLELLDTQLHMQKEERVSAPPKPTEIDHSLALKVADEIVRIEKNLAKMDPSIKTIKPLNKAIERVKDTFLANNYEIITYLNTEFDERLNLDVIHFVNDPDKGSENGIITRVIKPQVNFNDKLVQRAQVEVTVI